MNGRTTGEHRCRWRDVGAQVDDLLAEYAGGASVAALAAQFAVDATTVRAVLNGHGVHVRSAAEQRIRQTDAEAQRCTPRRHGCRWAGEADIVALLTAYADGASRRAVARDFNLSPGTVERILTAHGHVLRDRSAQAIRQPLDLKAVARARRDGVPVRELVEEAGISRQALSRRLTNQGYGPDQLQPRPCTKRKHRCRWARTVPVGSLLARYDKGASQTELADRFSITRETVRRILDDHGFHRRSVREQAHHPRAGRATPRDTINPAQEQPELGEALDAPDHTNDPAA
jgi:uncharacterized protein (DUF433 family)